MRAHGQTLGTLSLIATRPGRTFSRRDLELVATLADRCGLAVGNARLHREREEAAHTLERTLLPPSLPDIPGVELGVRYRPAQGEVGGDFYDAFPHRDGYLVLVGDVGGKGVAAAAVTGIARHTARAAAFYEPDTIGVLRALNRALLAQPEGTICTATCLRVTNHHGRIEVAATSAGPPRPLRLTATGSVEEVGSYGTLLGAFEEIELEEHHLTLEPGEKLVLFSDGLPEARIHGQFFGDERIQRLVASSRDLSAVETAERLERAAVEFQNGTPRDDIAIAVLSVPRTSPQQS
jgi:serine phosphatase RsbU (regulator of sigma subunit)